MIEEFATHPHNKLVPKGKYFIISSTKVTVENKNDYFLPSC